MFVTKFVGRVLRILLWPVFGIEGSPIHPRKVCETCGGKGYTLVNGEKQKCTVCKGTGHIESA